MPQRPPPLAPPVAGRPLRVLVVDDSAFMRFTLSKHIGEAPGLVLAGVARDGQEALEQIPGLAPDVITLDVEMPRLDGLATLRQIMLRFPRPVVMLSSLTTEGARTTVQALAAGAVDVVAKPAERANVAVVMDEVLAKVRAAGQARVRAETGGPVRRANGTLAEPAEGGAPGTKEVRPLRSRDRVVVIGSSTGGPRALHTVLADLPARLAAAVVLVQHMPVGFTRSLADRLNLVSPLAVKEAEPGDTLQVGQALMAPGGYHLTIGDGHSVTLDQKPAVNGVRPAVDVTMLSIAQRYGAQTVGVVLTGMGRDGTTGAQLIHHARGRVIAEAEETSVVWGMPRSVVEAGLADEVLPLPEIAAAIQRAVCG